MPRRPEPRAPRSTARPTTESRPHVDVDLVLYVSASSQYTHVAVRNCEQLLARFDRRRLRFEICDISQHPDRAEADKVVYTPMLVKRSPPPRTHVLGNLSNVAALVELLESCGLERSQ